VRAKDEGIAEWERPSPIVMTLQFDARSAGFFERQRQAYFPPPLNRVPAHLTLFHNLPGQELAAIVEAAAGLAGRTAPFPIAVAEIVSLGRGVAYRLHSPALDRLRADLAERFAPWLTGQDRERLRPHVTVQNQVDPAIAAATRAALASAFTPFSVTAEGLQLWHYRGGPWAPAGAIGFVGAADRVADRRSR
jgi:2'-5' RNA ligase